MYDFDDSDHDFHDCEEEHCGWYWCEDCDDEHRPNDWCENGILHQEYCDCSECQPRAGGTVTVTPTGGVL